MGVEKQLQRVLDREAIKELRYQYCYTVDRNRWEAFIDLFADDATIDHGPTNRVFEGRGEITEFVEELKRDHFCVHMLHNPVIDVDGARASGTWYFEVVQVPTDETAEWLQGVYDEEYRKVEDTWKFDTIGIEFNYRGDCYDQSWVPDIVG